jgi:chromate transporter
LTFLRASIFSTGGQSGLPLLREDLLRLGALTDAQIIDGLVIGRLSTGPGGLYMVSLGFLAGGWLGGAVALAAIALPPLVVLPASAYLRPRLPHRRVNGLVRGLTFTTSGLVVATSLDLLLSASGAGGPAPWQLALAAIGLAASLEAKRHPVLIVGVGAAVGLLVAR